jgi:hypothetical protein
VSASDFEREAKLLLGAKHLDLISAVRPWIDKLRTVGVHYHPELLLKFLAAMGE